MIVLDACAAIEAACGTSRSRQLKKFVFGDEKIVVPSVFFSEVANTMWKKARFDPASKADWRKLFEATVSEADEVVPDSELLPEALAEAIKHGHPVYDMLYVVLAHRRDAPFVTCDRKLAKICEESGVECVMLVEM